MANVANIEAKQKALQELYHEHLEQVLAIQEKAINELVPSIVNKDRGSNDGTSGESSESEGEDPSTSSEESKTQRCRQFLQDKATIFRFFRRSKFDVANCLDLLSKTLKWRLSSKIDLTSIPAGEHAIPEDEGEGDEAVDDLAFYASSPLLFFHPELEDKWGRPALVVNLNLVRRSADKLDGLKEYIAYFWETGRRYLANINSRPGRGDENPVLQMVILANVEGAGMSNMEVELVPYFLDLLRSHFPGMIGAVFILNYGWLQSGMWQLIRRILPQQALDRIMFPNGSEMSKFFDTDRLLKEHGGNLSYNYDVAHNSILSTFGGPSVQPRILDDALDLQNHSHASSSTKTPMSPLDYSGNSDPLSSQVSNSDLKGKGRDYSESSNIDFPIDSTPVSHHPWGFGFTPFTSTDSPEDERRPRTRASSQATSRTGSPQHRRRRRYYSEIGSSTSHRSRSKSNSQKEPNDTEVPQELHRYDISNPFFGYRPYFPLGRRDDEDGRIKRKRRRDLVWTLTYLFMLRVLQLHRKFQRAATSAWFKMGRLIRLSKPGSKQPQFRKGANVWWIYFVILCAILRCSAPKSITGNLWNRTRAFALDTQLLHLPSLSSKLIAAAK